MLPAGVMAVSGAAGPTRRPASCPVALLSLSLPFWADLVPALVSLASAVVGTWVRWFGMTALIEGSSISLPMAACSSPMAVQASATSQSRSARNDDLDSQ